MEHDELLWYNSGSTYVVEAGRGPFGLEQSLVEEVQYHVWSRQGGMPRQNGIRWIPQGEATFLD